MFLSRLQYDLGTLIISIIKEAEEGNHAYSTEIDLFDFQVAA